MRTLAALALATALALPTGAALAADLPPEPGVVVDNSGFNWDRTFATLYGVYVFPQGGGNASFGEGVSLGVNKTSNNILFGATGTVGALQGGNLGGSFIVQGVGRIGVLLGDQVALYGLAGLGFETASNALYLPTGLGVEFALNDKLSLRAQYQANYSLSQNAWVSSTSLGLSFYF